MTVVYLHLLGLRIAYVLLTQLHKQVCFCNLQHVDRLLHFSPYLLLCISPTTFGFGRISTFFNSHHPRGNISASLTRQLYSSGQCFLSRSNRDWYAASSELLLSTPWTLSLRQYYRVSIDRVGRGENYFRALDLRNLPIQVCTRALVRHMSHMHWAWPNLEHHYVDSML